jgi:hypothetical protein
MTVFNIKKLKYDIDQILGHFQLKRGTKCRNLDNLTQVKVSPDFVLPEMLEEQRQKLEQEGDVWNEEELKMHFLSPVFLLSKFEVRDKMKLFYERQLSSVVNGTPLLVICDALLASPYGINTPQKPYFFLQEFKKGKQASDDAEGQMLIAMLIAQTLNADDEPVYGCYLIGKYWHFSTLQGTQYCLSRSYDATQTEQLALILHILQNLKHVVKL